MVADGGRHAGASNRVNTTHLEAASMFPRLQYLEWLHGRPGVALHDLGSSDLRSDRDGEPTLVPGPLEGLEDPPVGATVELQLAQHYGVEPEQVLVTPGATAANLLAAASVVRLAGDSDTDERATPRVLVEKPGYEPLVKTPAGVGAAVDRFRRDTADGLDPDRITAAMTPETELVTVTNRHNPSGRLVDRETLAGIASAVQRAGGRLLVDEVYAPYGTSAEPDESGRAFGGVTAAGLDGAVVTSSLTKFFGLGDLSIGWLIGDRAFVDTARDIDRHLAAVAGPSRALARRALHNLEYLGERSRTRLTENARLLSAFVERREGVAGTVEPGSTFAFLDVAGVDGDELASAAWKDGILVVPGRFFDDPERVRIALGGEPETAEAGLQAFGSLLDRLAEGDARQTEA
jgi:aspartate/methionine/tyrosine aminotransferase